MFRQNGHRLDAWCGTSVLCLWKSSHYLYLLGSCYGPRIVYSVEVTQDSSILFAYCRGFAASVYNFAAVWASVLKCVPPLCFNQNCLCQNARMYRQ